jgi:large subunit ribosomal protein L19
MKNMQDIEKELTPQKEIPEFWPGDELAVSIRIKEGEKERIQIFNGICIGRKGSGTRETFTVRKISYGEGVERSFPVYSPDIAQIEVLKKMSKNRLSPRAKYYYLRKRKK